MHGFAARAFGAGATLFQYFVNIDLHRTSVEAQAVISAVGPLFSFVFGVFWMLVNRRWPRPLFLYLGAIGMAIFLGNLLSLHSEVTSIG